MSQPEDDPEAPAARGAVSLPARAPSPWRRLAVRLFAAFATFAFTVAVVYVDRGGYRDSNDDGMSLIDVIYYVTVTLSTTGYRAITPASDSARLINAFVVTPARVVFLVLLIGTTLEVLAVQGREELRISAWRRRMKKHTIVVGYGIKGRSAPTAASAIAPRRPAPRRTRNTDMSPPIRRPPRRHRPDRALPTGRPLPRRILPVPHPALSTEH